MSYIAFAGIGLAALVLGIAYWAVIRGGLGVRSIRTRLLLGFVLMAALPAVAISSWMAASGVGDARRQALDRLESVAARKESELRSYTLAAQNEVAQSLNDAFTLDSARVALYLDREQLYLVYHTDATIVRLQGYVRRSQHLQQLMLLDPTGKVVLSTDPSQATLSAEEQALFMRGLSGIVLDLPSAPTESACSCLLVAMPVIDRDATVLGVLAARTSAQALTDILMERTGLGSSGRAYLVDQQHALAIGSALPTGAGSSGAVPETLRSAGIDAALSDHTSGAGLYTNYLGRSVVGVHRWVGELQSALLVEQDLSETLRDIYTAFGVNLAIALASLLLAAGVSLLITRSIAGPLVKLAGTASRIAAGDLEQTAPVARQDEVGALARSFNSMTMQLRGLINGLEERVAERTLALRRRALQQETSARVGREITSILSIDDLLARVAGLIQNAFQYYHVNVYLVDDDTRELVLRASSGLSHPKNERLALDDNSLNGRAARLHAPVVANDVTRDPRYLPDESLSETRSELVVPLSVGGEIVGTLDAHSSEPNAFSTEDTSVIQGLGDQIAIAIHNARLYQHSRELAVLEERNRLARELHDSVTQSLYSIALFAEAGGKLARAGKIDDVVRQFADVGDTAQQALREMRLQLYELRPFALAEEGLIGALQRRLDTVERRSGLTVVLEADPEATLTVPVEDALYRIAQEALNNIMKHSGATSVTIVLETDGDRIRMTITDNGKGFDPDGIARAGGMGLASMRERAQALEGVLSIRSAPGHGTSIVVSVARSDPPPSPQL